MPERTDPDTHLHLHQQTVQPWKLTQKDACSHTYAQISLTTGGDDSDMTSCREQTTISLPHTRNCGEISRSYSCSLIAMIVILHF